MNYYHTEEVNEENRPLTQDEAFVLKIEEILRNASHLIATISTKKLQEVVCAYEKQLMGSFLSSLDEVKKTDPEAYNEYIQMIDWKEFYHELYDKE